MDIHASRMHVIHLLNYIKLQRKYVLFRFLYTVKSQAIAITRHIPKIYIKEH